MSYYTLTPVDFNPFEPQREIDKIIPLNEPQIEIWLSCLLGGDEANLAYNESISLDLKGFLNITYFIEAIKQVVLRHEALRASISPNGESLIIYKNIPYEVNVEDISGQGGQQTILKEFIDEQMHSIFDLKDGILFKTYLHKLSETHYYFTIVKHHIIGDGWSTGVILEDLSKIYNSKVRGAKLVLDPATQISKYVKDIDLFKAGKSYQKTKDYWLNMYSDQVPVLDLPTDFPRPQVRTYRADRIDYHLPLELIAQVKQMGIKAGSSLVNTLLSAFEVFLHLETNQKDIVVGLPAAGQSATENFGLVGHCVNLLPLRSSLETNDTFLNYLKRRKSAFFDAYDHQHFTYGQLVKLLNIKRDPSRIPLVPVIFNIDMGMDNAVSFEDLDYKLISNPRAFETFEIFVNATGSKSAFILEWSYNTQLFKASTIDRMTRSFEKLLQTLVNNPDALLEKLSSDRSEQWKIQLNTWNNSVTSNRKDKLLINLIDETALKMPDKVAVVYKQQTLTYTGISAQSNQLACYLLNEGIKPGDIIGLITNRSIEMVICLLGILKAGAVYVPLDPDYPVDRIEFMLSDANARMLMTSRTHSGKFTTTANEQVIEDLFPKLNLYHQDIPAVTLTGNDLAYLLYTSGSTGKPKGVMITHLNLVNFLTSMQSEPGITVNDRLLAITTISFDIAGLELYLPLITGATLIVCDDETAKDGRQLIDLIAEKDITLMQATPTTWQMMIDSGWSKSSKLKALCGGEALPKPLAVSILEKAAELWNMYGPTETTIWSTVKKVQKNDVQITIGHPIQNTSIYILDEQNNLLAPGNTGEIFIGGDGVAAGYYNRAELTNERFVADSFNDIQGRKLYKTGDLGKFLDNGEIVYQGRTDQQVKIRGHRIELGEIEAAITAIKEIGQAVVTAQEDDLHDKSLIAYVILENHVHDLTSWKDRWDIIYDMAAKSKQDLAPAAQKMDGILLEQWENSEDLLKQSAEWLKVSADRIKAIHAQHILEIGSGGGQLLFELAPFCKSYIATDYASTAIDKLNEQLALNPEKWQHVIAKTQAADNFSQISDALDLIIIHSVAQYFPDTVYLLKVIKEAINKLDNGGCLFIGDMQGKNSLEMHHAASHFKRAKKHTSIADFREVVDNLVRIEDELLADPQFFYMLPTLIQEISAVEVQLRQGSSLNETTKYHYDIWLYKNSSHQYVEPAISLNWKNLNSIDDVYERLKKSPELSLEIKDVFNFRTASDYKLLLLLKTLPPTDEIEKIETSLNDGNQGEQPDLFWELGNSLGFTTHIRWTNDGTDGNFDVIFIPREPALLLPYLPNIIKTDNISYFANTPLVTNEEFIERDKIKEWKALLKRQLPEYMVPKDFVGLKKFPLTPNKKIDKKALPKPKPRLSGVQIEGKSPYDESEQIIANIWSKILNIDHIDVNADFFELGGHSLLALKVMAAIEQETGKRLPLVTLFENSSIKKLAKQIYTEQKLEWNALVPIKTTGSKPPLYLIHGGGLNVLFYRPIINYLNDDQPVYGIQALGLYKEFEIPPTIAEIASVYIHDLLKANAEGPYYLTGYSLGGIIAFEMSKQLTEMGKQVKFVGIVDTYVGERIEISTKTPKLFKTINHQLSKTLYITESFFKYPKDTFAYQVGVAKVKLKKLFPFLNYSKESSLESYVEDFTPYEKEIYNKYSDALDHYVMKPAQIKVSLLRVKKRIYYVDDSIYLGWKYFAKKGVGIYPVNGDHGNILLPPNDQNFALMLQKAIDDAT